MVPCKNQNVNCPHLKVFKDNIVDEITVVLGICNHNIHQLWLGNHILFYTWCIL